MQAFFFRLIAIQYISGFMGTELSFVGVSGAGQCRVYRFLSLPARPTPCLVSEDRKKLTPGKA